jgi:hypothetical protein
MYVYNGSEVELLPFIKKPPQTGLLIKLRPVDGKSESKEDEGDDSGLEACAKDLIDAIHSKDIKAVKAALKATFEICDSSEDSEDSGSSAPSPHSYEAQNKKAGQE